VHRVPDYTGASKEERTQRIRQIIAIAKDNGYDSIFAGYGFMSEDEELVKAIEEAGLTFIGPCSRTVRGAGFKDEAKRTALAVGVSVTPGIDNVTALTLLAKFPDTRRAAKRWPKPRSSGWTTRCSPIRQPARGAGRRGAQRRLSQGHRPVQRRGDVRQLEKRVAEMYHEVPAEPRSA
jgi:hypothetical protein